MTATTTVTTTTNGVASCPTATNAGYHVINNGSNLGSATSPPTAEGPVNRSLSMNSVDSNITMISVPSTSTSSSTPHGLSVIVNPESMNVTTIIDYQNDTEQAESLRAAAMQQRLDRQAATALLLLSLQHGAASASTQQTENKRALSAFASKVGEEELCRARGDTRRTTRRGKTTGTKTRERVPAEEYSKYPELSEGPGKSKVKCAACLCGACIGACLACCCCK